MVGPREPKEADEVGGKCRGHPWDPNPRSLYWPVLPLLATMSVGCDRLSCISGDWPSPKPKFLPRVYPALPRGPQPTDMMGSGDRTLGPLNRDINRHLHTLVYCSTIQDSQQVEAP